MNLKLGTIVRILKNEIQRTNGCTDVGSVSFAVARAVEELGEDPDRIEVTTSSNLYKNAMNVGVPGTGMRGLAIAAALGAVIHQSSAELAILDFVTEEYVRQAKSLLETVVFDLSFTEAQGPLYIHARVFAGANSAAVVIQGDYANVVEVSYNHQARYQAPTHAESDAAGDIQRFSYAELYALIEASHPGAFEFLLESAQINEQAALLSQTNPNNKFRTIYHNGAAGRLFLPFDMMAQSKRWTGMASEARMSGDQVPVMALGGSGNQGITNFLSILAVAKTLEKSPEETAKALAISTATALYIKSFMARVTALCGSALAVGPGVAAGTVFLLGGSYQTAVHAIQSVIGTLNGTLCEGAGALCPFKLSAASQIAIESAYLALQGVYAPGGYGTIDPDIEQTFKNLGLINASLADTDRLLLRFVEQGHQKE